MIQGFFQNLSGDLGFYGGLLLSHIQITLLSVALATIIGLLIGIWISKHKKYAGLLISIINVIYTVPSIALLGVLISFTGIGNTTAIIALTVYALLPIVRSTYTGITNIDPKIVEAALAMGSTESQILRKIELPLAFPVIFSALRNMVTMTIALAGIASFVGAGGLGVAIYRGITTNNKGLILTGSFLIAALALLFDFLLGLLEKRIHSRKKLKKEKKLLLAGLAVLLVIILAFVGGGQSKKSIHLASKPVTEGYIIAELAKQVIEANSDLEVKMTLGVGGGTSNIHPAIIKGDFDLYPEYTGTSWQIVLKREGNYSNEQFEELKSAYEAEYGLTWLGMFGFNNTYGLGVQKEIADRYNLKTYSDLAKVAGELSFGAEYDFFEREDGFKALTEAYGLQFQKEVDMDNGLKYQALLDKKIDVMTIFTTDGQLSDPRIVVLEDDKAFYPSYMAGMVVRLDVLEKYPELRSALLEIDNLVDEASMAKMNYEVEVENKKAEDVAKAYLQEKGKLR